MRINRTDKAEKKLYRDTIVKILETFDFSDLGLPIRLPRPVRINSARTVAEAIVRPIITSK
jgi:hypothetical protein